MFLIRLDPVFWKVNQVLRSGNFVKTKHAFFRSLGNQYFRVVGFCWQETGKPENIHFRAQFLWNNISDETSCNTPRETNFKEIWNNIIKEANFGNLYSEFTTIKQRFAITKILDYQTPQNINLKKCHLAGLSTRLSIITIIYITLGMYIFNYLLNNVF